MRVQGRGGLDHVPLVELPGPFDTLLRDTLGGIKIGVGRKRRWGAYQVARKVKSVVGAVVYKDALLRNCLPTLTSRTGSRSADGAVDDCTHLLARGIWRWDSISPLLGDEGHNSGDEDRNNRSRKNRDAREVQQAITQVVTPAEPEVAGCGCIGAQAGEREEPHGLGRRRCDQTSQCECPSQYGARTLSDATRQGTESPS